MRWIGLEGAQAHVRSGHAVKWLTALAMVVSIGMLALGGVTLLDARTEAWRSAEQGANNLALTLSRDIARTVTQNDMALQRVTAALMRPDIDRIAPEARQSALFDRENSAPLVILNAKGDPAASSATQPPPRSNVAGQDYFKVHQDRADAGLFIGRPIRNPGTGIPISRRITRSDGTFNGVAAIILPLSDIVDTIEKYDLGAAGSVTLLASDGRVILRLPARDSDIDYGHAEGDLVLRAIAACIARPSLGDSHASLVARADAALNAAKDAGRNVVSRAAADGTVSVGEQPLFRQPARA